MTRSDFKDFSSNDSSSLIAPHQTLVNTLPISSIDVHISYIVMHKTQNRGNTHHNNLHRNTNQCDFSAFKIHDGDNEGKDYCTTGNP